MPNEDGTARVSGTASKNGVDTHAASLPLPDPSATGKVDPMLPKNMTYTTTATTDAPAFIVDGVEHWTSTTCCDYLIAHGERSANAYQVLARMTRAGAIRYVTAGRLRVYHAGDVRALAKSRRP